MLKIKHNVLFAILYFVPVVTCAQLNESIKYSLITNSSSVGYGYSNVLDPYLSPFEYKGNIVEYLNDKKRYLTQVDTAKVINFRFGASLGDLKHPAGINSMMTFYSMYDVGLSYHFSFGEKTHCYVGGSWDFYLGGKYIARNVNNPFSLDLQSNVNFTLSANYHLKLKLFNFINQNIRLEYGAKTSFIGCMFVPPQGASYYEIFSLRNTSSSFHLSSLHNKRGISHYVNIDIPVKFTTFRVALRNDLSQYKMNGFVYHNYSYSLQAGCVFDFYIFNGTKNKAPHTYRKVY